MNSILNPEKIEQLDLWAAELRPILLNILKGTNILSRGQLFNACAAKSHKLKLHEHLVNMDQFSALWNEYLHKIKLIKDILWTVKHRELHADLIRIFLRQICKLEAVDSGNYRHSSLNARLANFEFEHLLNIEIVHNFLERCGIFFRRPPTLADLCVRKICSEFNVDALYIPSLFLKQKINAEREHWPRPPPIDNGTRKWVKFINFPTKMDGQQQGGNARQLFYDGLVVAAESELKFDIREHDVPLKISSRIGPNLTLRVKKHSGEFQLWIEEIAEGVIENGHFEMFGYASADDPDKLQDDGEKIEMFYANLSTGEDGDGSVAQAHNRRQYFQLEFGLHPPDSPIRHLLSRISPGWIIKRNPNIEEDLKCLVFTIRHLKARSDYPDFSVQTAQRGTAITIDGGDKFFVNKEFLIRTVDSNKKEQENQERNFFLNHFAQSHQNVENAAAVINVEGFCMLKLLAIQPNFVPPKSKQIFEDFLLTLLHSISPNRDNICAIWVLASAISVDVVIDKCKDALKNAREIDFVERKKLAEQMKMDPFFLTAIVNHFTSTATSAQIAQAFNEFGKLGPFH